MCVSGGTESCVHPSARPNSVEMILSLVVQGRSEACFSISAAESFLFARAALLRAMQSCQADLGSFATLSAAMRPVIPSVSALQVRN